MGQDCGCGNCNCGKDDTKTPEEPAYAEKDSKPTESELASAGKKVEDLKKAIEECGFEVEQDGEEIIIEIPE